MARPKKQIDPKQVESLALINCTTAEMAAVIGCSSDTLERRFAAIIKEGREKGRMSLKRKQFQAAMSGNTTMLIWLGKQLLGQTDKVENTHGLKDPYQHMTEEQLFREQEKLDKLLGNESKKITAREVKAVECPGASKTEDIGDKDKA